jgi:putative two-component system response regulator
MTKQRILFADDEPLILQTLQRMLREYKDVWEMHFFNSGWDVLDWLSQSSADVIVSDGSMPGLSGYELLAQLQANEATRDIPVVILTGNLEAGLKRKALNLGAADLLNKPVDTEDLVARLRSMLRLKAYQDQIRAHNATLQEKVAERTRELAASRLDIIWRLARLAEFRDADTGNHVVRVGFFCRVLAEALGQERGFTETLFLTSPLHDIGKIAIPDRILHKEGKLTEAERETMNEHCALGARILREDFSHLNPFRWLEERKPAEGTAPEAPPARNPFLEVAADIALSHHERWDGTGYPRSLSGEQISLEARIVALADVYDALCSVRPYKPVLSESSVLSILEEGNGKHFDPQVFQAFLKAQDEIRTIQARFADKGSVRCESIYA